MKTNSTVPVHYTNASFEELNSYILKTDFSKIFILVDENTKKYCLPILKEVTLFSFSTIEIKSSETHKNLDTLQQIWKTLTDKAADRKSLLLNLGGGVITDIGGFAAATFKRGMRFINIPTTLLGMVDASVGGKTGIDFNGLKNQIGLFTNPEMVLVYKDFLQTLPTRELQSGMAEVIKYGLIADIKIWKYFKELNSNSKISNEIIQNSIQIKEQIVQTDPKEKGIRKTLNFGHTLGHAIETHFLSKSKKKQLLHGEAVAIGMILATHLSYQTKNLPLQTLTAITSSIKNYYQNAIPKRISKKDYSPIIDLLKHDKKNTNGKVNFILISAIGKPLLDCEVTDSEIVSALDYYSNN